MPGLPTVPVEPSSPAAVDGEGEATAAEEEAAAEGGVGGTVIPDAAVADDPDGDGAIGTVFGTAEPVTAEPDTVDEQETARTAARSSVTADAGARRRSGDRGTSAPYKAPPSAQGEHDR